MTPLLAIAVLQAATAAAPAATRHASANDCAVIVAIGKAELGWGPNSSGEWPFFPDYDLPGGGSYVEDCAWRTLGVAPPVIGSPASMQGAAISRPAYGPDGATATAQLSTTMRGQDSSSRPTPPFMQDRTCKLERSGTTWRVLSCDTTAIT